MDDGRPQPVPPPQDSPAVSVLASGSSGNCTVMVLQACGRRRLCLIDAGLSPRRTERMLEALGLSLADLDSIILTHLDHDHYHSGWATGLPDGACLRLHRRHAARARNEDRAPGACEPFEEGFELCPGVHVRVCMASHDQLGVASFRFDFAGWGSSLGFATDLGRITDALLEHLRGVDVLAIESNYCPQLQHSSLRPWFLKRRIMGGQGHLSNDQALRAIEEIGPRSHVVFLHLSRECNRPEIISEMHAGADYAITIAAPETPTRWVHVRPPLGMPPVIRTMAQLPLFGTSSSAQPAESPALGLAMDMPLG
jgi:phosphoribosyl 1,2-cyclic phosphodiesterase